MAEILNLQGQSVGENFNVDPNAVLESAKGQLTEVVVAGLAHDGTVYLAGSKGSMQTLWLLEAGKWVLMRQDEANG